jgi:hypothetical protein
MKQLSLIAAFFVLALTSASAQHSPGMHFDQHAATHHFLLSANGGSIVISANDANDTATLSMVRSHLQDIAQEFAQGQFDSPMITHGEVPAGVAVMIAKKQLIKYSYEERPSGGVVVVSTSDAAALKAIHEFMRYQITEHKTGDPLTIARQ